MVSCVSAVHCLNCVIAEKVEFLSKWLSAVTYSSSVFFTLGFSCKAGRHLHFLSKSSASILLLFLVLLQHRFFSSGIVHWG